MMIDFMHILLATTVILLWLVIVAGWLVTCGHGEIRAILRSDQPHDPSPLSASRDRRHNSIADP
jgi:hypothetical protein